jgi:hypothetical protein
MLLLKGIYLNLTESGSVKFTILKPATWDSLLAFDIRLLKHGAEGRCWHEPPLPRTHQCDSVSSYATVVGETGLGKLALSSMPQSPTQAPRGELVFHTRIICDFCQLVTKHAFMGKGRG